MVSNLVMQDLINDINVRKGKVIDFMNTFPIHRDWLKEVVNVITQIEELFKTLLSVVYSEYNEVFIDELFDAKTRENLSREENHIIDSIKQLPEKIAHDITVNLAEIFEPFHFLWFDEIMENGRQNFDEITKYDLKQRINVNMENVAYHIATAKVKVRSISNTLTSYLESMANQTNAIKETASQLKWPKNNREALRALQTLRKFSNDEIPEAWYREMHSYQDEFIDSLHVAGDLLQHVQKWLETLLIFKPTYMYSDENEVKIALSTKLSDLENSKIDDHEPVANIQWVGQLITIFRMSVDLIDKLNIRLMNETPENIKKITDLLEADTRVEHITICREISKLLTDYKIMHRSLNLKDSIGNSLIEFNYNEAISDYLKIDDKMKMKEAKNLLETVMENSIKYLEVNENVIVSHLPESEFVKNSLDNSNNFRMNLFSLKHFYKINKENPRQLRALKTIFGAICSNSNKNAPTFFYLEQAITNYFKNVRELPNKIRQILDRI